jgi:hypothetical protein
MYGVSATPVVNYALDDPINNVIDTPTLNEIEGRVQKRDADDKKKQGKEKKEKGVQKRDAGDKKKQGKEKKEKPK